MNPRSNMVIIKGEIQTTNVASCDFKHTSGKCLVTYTNGKSYDYNLKNVVILNNPTSLNPQAYHIRHKGRDINNVSAIFSFRDGEREYWYILCNNNNGSSYELSADRRDLEIEESCLENVSSKKIFDYLKSVAGQVSVEAEDGTPILGKQYEKVDYLGSKSAAAVYLNPNRYSAGSGMTADAPIFPFGCNKSQYAAVTNALNNRVSVIEGPPGTGKTQTILNLIANLVLNGKTVQVVSNNNSAIENVLEKLASPKYQLDFFVASLGRQEKKQAFIENQTGMLPDLSPFRDVRYSSPEFYEEVKKTSLTLGRIFEAQNELARLKQEKHDVELEQSHYRESNGNPGHALKVRKNLSSSRLMQLLLEYQNTWAKEEKPGLFTRLRFRILYGGGVSTLLKQDARTVVTAIQTRYYEARLAELEDNIAKVEDELKQTDAGKTMEDFTKESLACFRAKLAERYPAERRFKFMPDDLWQRPEEFLKEYPVVLSTTYTARSSLGSNARFDYVIMDEASQVDVATGVLALSSARNAVIVGDPKQLPNVITSEQKPALQEIFRKANVPDAYNFAEYSFLGSVFALLGDRIPREILREHYRCNPQIIGYCNQKFYEDELVVMTAGPDKALKVMMSSTGKHSRGHVNLRQAEIIRDEVLPELTCPKNEIGIITPYRDQVTTLRQVINDPEIDTDTIHKFQGREKDVIIFSTMDDIVTDFSDNPNLLNVAVSRAKKKFILVTSNEEQPVGSNVGDLIGYIRYQNCEIAHSKITSVFDYMHSKLEEERISFLKKHKRVSEYESENYIFGTIENVLKGRKMVLGVLANHPLYQMNLNKEGLNSEEIRFINTGLSHVDFLIYNKLTKVPVLAVEVDGYWFHRQGTRQAERDGMKNHILECNHIPLIRFATNGSREEEKLAAKLDEILGKD